MFSYVQSLALLSETATPITGVGRTLKFIGPSWRFIGFQTRVFGRVWEAMNRKGSPKDFQGLGNPNYTTFRSTSGDPKTGVWERPGEAFGGWGKRPSHTFLLAWVDKSRPPKDLPGSPKGRVFGRPFWEMGRDLGEDWFLDIAIWRTLTFGGPIFLRSKIDELIWGA